MKFIEGTPFFRLFLPFVLGILTYDYFGAPPPVYLLIVLFASLVFFLLSFFIPRYKHRYFFGFGVLLFFFSLSIFLCQKEEEKDQFDEIGRKAVFSVEIKEKPIEKRRTYQCRVEIKEIFEDSTARKSKGKALLYFQKDSSLLSLSSGDLLFVETEFSRPGSSNNQTGFNYADYLKRQGITATGYVAKERWRKQEAEKQISVFRIAEECRDRFLAIFKKFEIEGQNFSVLAAISFGYTDELEPDTRKGFSASGAMHILAVSGLHVGMIYGLLLILFSFLGESSFQKFVKVFLILFFLWTYALITGLRPSVFRASLMFSLVAVAIGLNRKSQIYNSIFLSAFFILLVNPNLLFHVGFQLSYSAVLSIVYFQPKIAKLLHFRNKVLKWFWDLTAVSIAAQIGTLPFVLYYFNTFPNYFIITNWIAIPGAAIVLYLSVALLLLSPIPYISSLVACLLNVVLEILNRGIFLISQLPYSVTKFEINEVQLLLIVFVICFSSYYKSTKRYLPLFLSLCGVCFFLFCHTLKSYKELTSDKIVVYSREGESRLKFVNGRKSEELVLFRKDSLEKRQDSQKAPLLEIRTSIWNKNTFVCFKEKRALIVTKNFLQKDSTEARLPLDFLIITSSFNPQIDLLLACVNPKVVIVDSSISRQSTSKIEKTCQEKRIVFHSIRTDGAYLYVSRSRPKKGH